MTIPIGLFKCLPGNRTFPKGAPVGKDEISGTKCWSPVSSWCFRIGAEQKANLQVKLVLMETPISDVISTASTSFSPIVFNRKNFATTKNTDWVFEPSKTYILKYRLLVYDGEMNVSTANQAWDAFASPLTYNIK